jgi:transposase-like protein
MNFRPTRCANPDCPFHQKPGGRFIKKGFTRVRRLNQYFRRYECKECHYTFSSRSSKPDFRHKKMDLNKPLQQLLTEGNSIRASARILKMTYRNTYKKFLWLIKQAKVTREKLSFSATKIYFDEMETIHHTKCKPLSIAIAVNEDYKILALQVAEMPAKGRLARFSVMKYGPRKDERDSVMGQVFSLLKSKLSRPPGHVYSDAKSSYRKHVEVNFPESIYEVHNRADKERHRDRLHEKLHKKTFDPLFAVNQRCAKLRSDIRRLTRRSWCTTKKPENLQGQLDLYIVNQYGSAFS